MTVSNQLYVGIDGGGTKTALGAFDATGDCVASAVCAPLNYHFIGVDAAVKHLKEGLTALGIPSDRIAAVGIGDPALDDVSSGEAALRFAEAARELLRVPIYIRSDAYMTLYGLTRGEYPGVLIISGTGAMAIGEDAEGRVSVAGGWGRLTGDEGSGYYIGLQALRAALHAADGIIPPTALTDAALSHFGCEGPRALIDVFYGESEPDVAGFSRVAAACAQAGDRRAHEILLDAARYLADYTSVLVRRTGAETVGVYGSVLCNNVVVRTAFEQTIAERFPHVRVTEPEISAQCAAALYARRQLEKEYNEK